MEIHFFIENKGKRGRLNNFLNRFFFFLDKPAPDVKYSSEPWYYVNSVNNLVIPGTGTAKHIHDVNYFFPLNRYARYSEQ